MELEEKGEDTEIDLCDPPSYNESTTSVIVDPPPSYDSLYGKLKQAKDQSDGNVDFAKTACGICFASVVPVVVILLGWGIALACIVMGAIHLKSCPAETVIPIYLVVYGVVFTLKTACTVVKYLQNRHNNRDEQPRTKAWHVERLLDCFLFVWFIVGNVFVYKTRGRFQSLDATLDTYCDKDLYLFAFWIITLSYILVAACLVMGCCCLCVICCCAMASSKIEN